ncbi:MAG: DUF1592 domain-containing protein [Bryobacteraceae bacterium]
MRILVAWGLSATCVLAQPQAVLNRYCLSCHNAARRTANVDLEHPTAAVWEKALDRVASRKMPPPGAPAPSAVESKQLVEWIEKQLGISANDPGRVTARRLNRTEYDNTVRDLLGIAFRPSRDFPVDDSGYGFDNNGDVLSVSPMLAEKYLNAARRLSRAAIFGEPYPDKPGVMTRLLAKRSHDAGASLSNSNYLPYSMRGSLYGAYRFPVDGEYEFRLRVANFRGQDEDDLTPADRERAKKLREQARKRGGPRTALTNEQIQALNEEARKQAPPRKVILTVDGATVVQGVVEGTTTLDYDRGEFIGRAAVKAGEHALRASYPELADLDDPRSNVNRDMRRKLFVDYLDIAGPYRPSTAPPESYRKLFVCGHVRGEHERSCVRAVIANVARQAYRRPVAESELAGLTALGESVIAAGDSVEEAVRVALQAILASPHFLFRVERDSTTATHAVNDFELASRLSYFLWATMPDEELFRLAAEKRLHQPAVLEAQVRRMLRDSRSGSLVATFAAQWLQLRNLDRSKPDPLKFPAVDDELVDYMRKETSLFLEAVIREDRSLVELIDAPFTFVNGPLARHYGISGVNGEEFRRVSLDGAQRGGLLSQASILTVSSYSTRTSPVIRGKWVLENLLGTPPPPPPPDVPQLDESKIGSAMSLRQQMEQHRKNPACAVCHQKMDAIGFGLENYDASGRWRTSEGNFALDTAGVMPDGAHFSGPQELKQLLKKQQDAFARNLAEKTLTYALGRGVEAADRRAVDRIADALTRDGYRFSTLALEIVRSAPFQMRRPEGATNP